jgi:hypothetical protein
VIDGVSYLRGDGGTREMGVEIKQLFDEYEQVVRRKIEEMEKPGREILHRLRISGSAIEGINLRVKDEWQQSLDKIAQPYQEKLEELRQKLLL